MLPRKREKISPPCTGRLVRTILIPLFCLTMAVQAAAVEDGTWGSPLKIYRGLSATFGEYRASHLHSGIDFKTEGKSGYRVYAVADGEIYRLRYTKRGYGKALYLRHKGGHVSLYAHLSHFSQPLGLEKILQKEIARRGKKYPGDIYLNTPIEVKKGEVIGFSGETGTGLPHLHFELRNEKNDPINPYLAGLAFKDELVPTLEMLLIEPVDHLSAVNGRLSTHVIQLDGRKISPPIIRGRVRLRLQAFDRVEAANRCGLFEIILDLDDKPLLLERFESFPREKAYQVGTIIDPLKSHISPTIYTYNLFRQRGADPGVFIYSSPLVDDYLDLESLSPGEHLLSIRTRDAAGNETSGSLHFIVNHRPTVSFPDEIMAFTGTLSIPVETFDGDAVTGRTRQVRSLESEYTVDGGKTWQKTGLSFEFNRFGAPLMSSSWTLKGEPPGRDAVPFQLRVRAFDGLEYSPWVRSPMIISLPEGSENKDHFFALPPGMSESKRIVLSFFLAEAANVTLKGHLKRRGADVIIKKRSLDRGWHHFETNVEEKDFTSPDFILKIERQDEKHYLHSRLPGYSEGLRPMLSIDNYGSYICFIVHQPSPAWNNPLIELAGPGRASQAIPTVWLGGEQYEALWPLHPSHRGHWEVTVKTDAGRLEDQASFEVRPVSAEGGGRLFWSDLELTFPEKALYGKAYVTRSLSQAKSDPDLLQVSEAYHLNITSYPFDKPVTVRLKPTGPYEDFSRLGIYSYNRYRQQWSFFGSLSSNGEDWVVTEVRHFSDYAVFEDILPPVITQVRPKPGSVIDSLSSIKFTASDRGMGIDDERISILLDGEELEGEYDPDRGWVTAPIMTKMVPGRHRLSIAVYDRAGNRSEAYQGYFDIR